MPSLKHGVMASAALAAGLMFAAPPLTAAPDEIGPNVSQSVGPRSGAINLAQGARSTARTTRAEMDAREREITKQLNLQQLQAMQSGQPQGTPPGTQPRQPPGTQPRQQTQAIQPMPNDNNIPY
jgi:hypothetical protein